MNEVEPHSAPYRDSDFSLIEDSSNVIVRSLKDQVNSFVTMSEFLELHPKAQVFGEGFYTDTKGNRFPVLFTVPGQGSEGDLCSEIKGKVECEVDLEHSWPFRPHHCNNITCPIDKWRVSMKRGRSSDEKMTKQAISAREQGIQFGKRKHWYLSPLKGTFSLDNWVSETVFQDGEDPYACNWQGFRIICDQIIKAVAKDGFYGGKLFIHPTRWMPVNKKLDDFLEEVESDEDENDDSEDPEYYRGEKVKKVMVFSPHAHFQGYGYLDTDKVPEGWRLWNISAQDEKKERNWVRTIAYATSHAQVIMTAERGPFGMVITKSKASSSSWIGALSTAHGGRIPGSKTLHEVECLCPKCRGEGKESKLHLVDDEEGDLGVKMAIIPNWEYHWKEKGTGGRRPGASKKKGFPDYIKKAPKLFDFKKSMSRVPWTGPRKIVSDEEREASDERTSPPAMDVNPLREASRRYHELGRFLEGWVLIDESDDPDPGGGT